MSAPVNISELQQRLTELESENAMLRRNFSLLQRGNAVSVPDGMKTLFNKAEQTVNEYFRDLRMDPTKGTIEINDQRYVLIRASALSKGFMDTIQKLYADRGENEAFAIGKNFLFDYAHVIGIHDAKDFHIKMNLTDPISKLSAGPVHFAYSGWAFVDILPESNPTPDENFYLVYNHPYSFEADSWLRAGTRSNLPVCIMNSGYSSGWCEESFGIHLTAVEVTCRAKGDEHCTFIMSPPHMMQQHLQRFDATNNQPYTDRRRYEIPTFFERKKVEEEMKKSQLLAEESAKSKTDFVANMSHELRTPLGAILGFTDLLKKTELTTVQKDYLEAISTSGSSLLSIINDILDLSRLDAGKVVIENTAFSIQELLHSVQVMFSSKAKKKHLKFTCSVDTAITYPVLGDPMRLTQILVNLIGNAIKFTESGGVYVNCSVEKETGQQVEICFSVRDTGIGIPADKIGSVFERFTQADTNITRKYGGTGLGLAISRQLIELLGGGISVKSDNGSGAEFCFTLPYPKGLIQQHLQPSKKVDNLPETHTLKKILVVEDNLMNQKLTGIILRNNGFEVTIAKNGREAVDILKENSADLILMDIQMPEMDGYKTTQVIRDELHIGTPIIAMTAHALAGEKEKCIHAGMSDYLSKPFKEADLLARINWWGSRKKTNVSCEPTDDPVKKIDLSYLRAQTKNNYTFIVEMVEIFRQQNPKDIETVQNAITENDYQAVYNTTHTLRSTIGFFGLTPVIGDELLCIEKLAFAKEQMDKIQQLFQRVIEVCRQAVIDLGEPDLLKA